MVHLAWLGRHGFRELGELLAQRTAYARERLGEVEGVELSTRRRWCGSSRCELEAPVDAVLDRCASEGSPPAIRWAASTRSTRTACWSRSPSGGRAQIDASPTLLEAADRREAASGPAGARS